MLLVCSFVDLELDCTTPVCLPPFSFSCCTDTMRLKSLVAQTTFLIARTLHICCNEQAWHVATSIPQWSYLFFSHEISCYGHVLEEDSEMEPTVAFPICDGGVCAVPDQLNHHGEVTLPVHRFKKQNKTKQRQSLKNNNNCRVYIWISKALNVTPYCPVKRSRVEVSTKLVNYCPFGNKIPGKKRHRELINFEITVKDC